MSQFSDGLIGQQAYTQVNTALEAARSILGLDPRLGGTSIKWLPSAEEQILPAPQLAVISAVRGAGLFLLDNCTGPVSEFSMAVSRVDRAGALHLASQPPPLLLLNRPFLERSEFVHLRCACAPSGLTPTSLPPAFADPPQAGRLHSLSQLAAMLSGVIAIQRAQKSGIVEMLFPAWH